MPPEDNPADDVQPTKEEWEQYERERGKSMVMDMTPADSIEDALAKADSANEIDGDLLTKKGAVKFDTGKIRMSLVPVKPLLELGRLYTFGAKKYADHNWRKGMTVSRAMDALERHFMAYKDGEDFDTESTQHHLAAVMFYCCVIMEQFFTGQKHFDDRFILGNRAPTGRPPYDGDRDG